MKRRRFGAGLIGVVAVVYLGNSSLARGAEGTPVLLAHRGLAQDFSREGLTMQTCTASRMLPPKHGYLENTLPSIEAALGYGADVVEIDIHPTTDGEFAVFHDWTLDCRTNGRGVTREQTMTYLKTLDVGYGYTADGGRTFPFRGKFSGEMPTLAEVAHAFPTTRFLVNIKGDRAEEADQIAEYLTTRNVAAKRLMFYGGDAPVSRLRTLLPGVRTMTKRSLKHCLTRYFATGWLGHLPSSCRNSVIFVPLNYRRLLWGWPNLFVARLAEANSEAFLIGPMNSKTESAGSTAIDDPQLLKPFIGGYAGGISTDRIDLIGPALGRSARRVTKEVATPGNTPT